MMVGWESMTTSIDFGRIKCDFDPADNMLDDALVESVEDVRCD
jgi:hypothetical protein